MPESTMQVQKKAADDVQNQSAGQTAASGSNASAKDEQMTQSAPKYVTAQVYTIKAGDSFWGIARKFDVPGGYEFLAEYNGMTPKSVIHPGQTLNIPKLNTEAAAPANEAPAAAEAPANEAPAAAEAPANEAPAAANTPANEAPTNEAPANEAPANEAPANEAPAASNDAGTTVVGLPTKSPIEQLLEEHPEITTNQQLISYFYNQCGKDLSKAYGYARSIYSVEIDDLCSNRQGAIDLEKPRSVFANKNAIFSYLVSNLGMSNAGACGVLANIQSESNFDTACVGDHGTSYGLCQWHLDRKSKLIKFCTDNGYDLNSIPGQLEYLAKELGEDYSGVLTAMKNAPNTEDGAYQAAYTWCVDFESPENENAMGKIRGGVAKNYFQTYGNVTTGPAKEEKPETPAASPSISTNDTPTSGNEPAAANEPAGNEPAAANEPAAQTEKPKASGYIETSDTAVNDIQKAHPNGITVSLYGGVKKDSFGNAGYEATNNNREFTSLATGVAKETKTVDTDLNLGSAMMANSSDAAKKLTNKVYDTLHDRYNQAKPASAEENPEHLKIKNLSLYYHGNPDSLGFPRGGLNMKSVDSFVNDIRGSLRGDVRVQLYACSTASTKYGEENFAKTMAESLGGEARVYGHENPGHATENANASYYDGQGNATSMFDALMPEAWIRDEAARIWGPDYTSEAYSTLVARLKIYYNDVCGLGGGWEGSRRKSFETSTPDAPKAYGDAYKYSGMGRAMFSDTEGSATMLQQGWRTWALGNERSNLKKGGALAATFEDINATPATTANVTATTEAPVQAQANEAPAQAQQEQAPTDSSKLVVIGDSRTVGMRDYAGLSAGQIIAEVGKGFPWLISNALPQAQQSGLTNYVVLLGVNDLGNADAYAKKYSDLIKSGINITIVNVGPVNEDKCKQYKYTVTNADIAAFNSKIASVEGARVIDLYSFLNNNGYNTSDGLHYTVSTYKDIVNYLQSNW